MTIDDENRFLSAARELEANFVWKEFCAHLEAQSREARDATVAKLTATTQAVHYKLEELRQWLPTQVQQIRTRQSTLPR